MQTNNKNGQYLLKILAIIYSYRMLYYFTTYFLPLKI